jgi:putative pyruvate formate lyase activating enzyme
VDIYLPDFKYSDDRLAVKLSSAPNYVNTALAAIKEMIFQVGEPEFDDDGIMKSGVIVRQLILPAHTRNSIEVLNILKREFDSQILVSLMCQYVPWGEVKNDPKLGRKITKREYEKVKRVLFDLELDGFTQDLSSATEEYIPDWEL